MNPTKNYKDMSSQELSSLASTMEMFLATNKNAKKIISTINKELKRRAK